MKFYEFKLIIKYCTTTSFNLGLPHNLFSPLPCESILVSFPSYVHMRWNEEDIITGNQYGIKTKYPWIYIYPQKRLGVWNSCINNCNLYNCLNSFRIKKYIFLIKNSHSLSVFWYEVSLFGLDQLFQNLF